MGPAPKTLIDPVSTNELRQAMLPALQGWALHILNHPNEIAHQGYQPYTVLSVCRILYTLEFGDIVSKNKAAGWVKETQSEKWHGLIDRAWIGRHNPQLPASPEYVNQTLDLIRYALENGSTPRKLKGRAHRAGDKSRGDRLR
ncbi:MAG: aminoglycoside adenylyltransferase domain-containing protein [Bacteroidota bacterium]